VRCCALTPVIVSISRCALASSSPDSPLARIHRCSRSTRLFAFELSPVEPHSPSFDATSFEGSGKLDHITSRWSGRTARAALVSNIPPRREASWAVTPVFVDQCQQSTILFSRWAPFVPAHFATCFPHGALALGFMPIEPASVFVSASCGPFPPTQRFHAYRACFVTCGSRQNAHDEPHPVIPFPV
jgi:hypothetical protein